MNGSEVSVIIPVYNREHSIGYAIESVLNQTKPPGEVMVVDDGSTDQTAKTIASFGTRVKLLQQPNKGVSAARNRGIKSASGKWLAFLDSDDQWLPDKLNHQLSLLEKYPDHRIIHSDEIWIRNGKRVNQKRIHQKSGGMIYEMCLPRCVISPSSVMIHRDIFDEYGLFDEFLPACEDYEMWLRICRREPVLYCEDPLITKYGGHDDQLSRTFPAMDRFRVQVLLNHLEYLPLSQTQIQALLKELTKKLEVLKNGALKRGKFPAYRWYGNNQDKALGVLGSLMS